MKHGGVPMASHPMAFHAAELMRPEELDDFPGGGGLLDQQGQFLGAATAMAGW